jgi:hypothetical protein
MAQSYLSVNNAGSSGERIKNAHKKQAQPRSLLLLLEEVNLEHRQVNHLSEYHESLRRDLSNLGLHGGQ